MNRGCLHCKEKGCLINQILKARKIKLEKDKRVIDQYLRNRLQEANHQEHEQLLQRLDSRHDCSEAYSGSERSVFALERPIYNRALNKELSKSQRQQNYQPLTDEEILTENARKFVRRLRKQKEYNEGKFMLLRKRQQERKERMLKRDESLRKSIDILNRKSRINNVMDKLLLQQSRLNERSLMTLKQSFVRSRTENSQRDESLRKSSRDESLRKSSRDEALRKSRAIQSKQAINSLKRQLKELSTIVDSL